ncbi:hypothetical protein TSAR_006859 [Trichomalopsis sarcophagae]|uniref:Uncharacterized protein n=1 Tax=Trichomalopsis sarcophagae TaxID=543379 RepID=A0A232EFJ0_9HYME|nr:hypothetical protein TSAR_006859 [Trichomalopsis sarcophagae]
MEVLSGNNDKVEIVQEQRHLLYKILDKQIAVKLKLVLFEYLHFLDLIYRDRSVTSRSQTLALLSD